MAWNTIRKEDKPYSFDKEGLTLVEYTNDGRLYFVDNLNNIIVNENDFLAVSYIPSNETDNRLPIVCVRGLGVISKDFTKICDWLNFNPKDTDELPRYHEENVIKNISRDDDDGMGGMMIISVNPATGEEMVSSSGSTFNRPQKPQNQNPNSETKPENHGNEVNTSEESNYDEMQDFLDSLESEIEKPNAETVQLEEQIGSIFSFIKKVH